MPAFGYILLLNENVHQYLTIKYDGWLLHYLPSVWRVWLLFYVYCGPVLRHPAELMLPAVDLGGRVWLGGKPCKGGPAAPAFGG